MIIGGGNGQWVRARNKEGAEGLLRERQMDAERSEAARVRSQAFWGAVARRARSIWRRMRR